MAAKCEASTQVVKLCKFIPKICIVIHENMLCHLLHIYVGKHTTTWIHSISKKLRQHPWWVNQLPTGNWELQNVAENNDHIHNAEPLGNFLGTQTL